MSKFKNKYRTQSNRLPNWDYGCNAEYFVTICTQNRECWFGEIVPGSDALPCVSLSEIGKIAQSEWLKTFEMRPDMNLWMGEFVVMPNHFHAIIGIGENQYNTQRGGGRDAMHCVSTTTDTTTNNDINLPKPKNQFGPQSKNLGSIIRGFKTGVTVNARKIQQDFAWQSNYYDHIIRDDKSYQNICNYIANNPNQWADDTLHPKNHRSDK